VIDVTWMEIAGETISINPVIYLLWCIWVGWIFSTVGAFGGIMAGVGHISILGIGDWASKLKGKAIDKGMYNDAGKYLTDHIRFSNTAITWLNSLSSTINWYTQKRLVWPAAIAMGLGMVLGAQVAVWGTGGQLGVKLYKGLFGIVTVIVSFYMFYQITPRAKASKSKGREAAQRFRQRVEELRKEGRLHELEGITNVKYSVDRVEFDFFGEHFVAKNYLPFAYGLLIGFVAALVGIGGGFAIVPFFVAIGWPMYIAPAVSALTVFLNQCSALAGWFARGVEFVTPIVVGWIGILVGSYIGPRTQKYLPMDLLFGMFGTLAFYVGIRYILAGLFGIKLPP